MDAHCPMQPKPVEVPGTSCVIHPPIHKPSPGPWSGDRRGQHSPWIFSQRGAICWIIAPLCLVHFEIFDYWPQVCGHAAAGMWVDKIPPPPTSTPLPNLFTQAQGPERKQLQILIISRYHCSTHTNVTIALW